jgi:hypothetical protein
VLRIRNRIGSGSRGKKDPQKLKIVNKLNFSLNAGCSLLRAEGWRPRDIEIAIFDPINSDPQH